MKPTNNDILLAAHIEIPPWAVRNILKAFRNRDISKRMLSYEVSRTIGEASTPADGRGSRRSFTAQDVSLMLAGYDLADFGLSPLRVTTCTGAMRDKWVTIFAPFLVGGKPEQFLVGYMLAGSFVAEIKPSSEITTLLETNRPRLLFNATRSLLENLLIARESWRAWELQMDVLTSPDIGPLFVEMFNRLSSADDLPEDIRDFAKELEKRLRG